MKWTEFLDHSKVLAEQLTLKKSEKKRLILGDLRVSSGLLFVGAALIASLELVFDEKNSVVPKDDDFVASEQHLSDLGLTEVLSKGPSFTLEGEVPALLKEAVQNFFTVFASSGSTGEAKLIAKHPLALLREVKTLKTLYALDSKSHIVSFVRPFHIYGYLHSFLLPLLTSGSVTYWNTSEALPLPLPFPEDEEANAFPKSPNLLVTVPAHFRLVIHILPWARPARLVTSGSSFGRERERELEGYASFFSDYIEILGSTETGGIAYRRLLRDSTFRPFEGVEWEPVEEGTRIYSPYLFPETSIVTADLFEATEDGQTFFHRGRADRIFKYGGQRHSLAEIEQILSKVHEGARVICHFLKDDDSARGGQLWAFVEKEEGAPSKHEESYRALGRRPFPQKIVFLKHFPLDAQGKTPLSLLIAKDKA